MLTVKAEKIGIETEQGTETAQGHVDVYINERFATRSYNFHFSGTP